MGRLEYTGKPNRDRITEGLKSKAGEQGGAYVRDSERDIQVPQSEIPGPEKEFGEAADAVRGREAVEIRMGRMSRLETGCVRMGEACPHTREAGEKRRVYAPAASISYKKPDNYRPSVKTFVPSSVSVFESR
jgi:hypothetical protein